MLFTNIRASQNQAPVQQKPLMMFTSKRKPITHKPRHIPSNVSIVKAQTYEEKVAKIQDGKKVKWGEPFWNLFHVLAEKVKNFPAARVGLLHLVYTICSNLPCPDCKNHAVQYLNGINFNNIRTRDDFKMMLYNFHNAVNVRKTYPIYPVEKLDKYESADLVAVINIFMSHFLAKHKSFHLIADDMQRRNIYGSVKQWFETNLVHF